MKIIFDNNGSLGQLIPAPKFLETLEGSEVDKLVHIANKDLPTGTRYELVDNSTTPNDRTFRNAWEYISGSDEKTSEDLSLEDQLKYNHISQEVYDANAD
jgi:hypothetical protein